MKILQPPGWARPKGFSNGIEASGRLVFIAGQVTARQGRQISFALAGVPFLSAATTDLPHREQTAEMRRDQMDQESEPGEQSLTGWWLRSQASWHQGAGAKFQEPRGSENPSERFFDSSGIDVWTPGELKLLKRAIQVPDTGTEATAVVTRQQFVYYITPTVVARWNSTFPSPRFAASSIRLILVAAR